MYRIVQDKSSDITALPTSSRKFWSLVDNSVLKDPEMLQIALRPAVELSYLRKEEQADLFSIMDEMDCTPSHAQAIKMRQMSEAKTGEERLSKDAMTVIMEEEKRQSERTVQNPKERISKYFAPGRPRRRSRTPLSRLWSCTASASAV